MSEKKRVLMVCLGNICRSPIAEAVFDNEISKRDLKDHWEVDSAGLANYHIGKNPDHRTLSTLEKNGITNYSHKARQITQDDFEKFDWIFGMDSENIDKLKNLKPNKPTIKPTVHEITPKIKSKIQLLGHYYPTEEEVIIHDPYYSKYNEDGKAEFQQVYEQCLKCVTTFLDQHAFKR